jgi:hypothetical protein
MEDNTLAYIKDEDETLSNFFENSLLEHVCTSWNREIIKGSFTIYVEMNFFKNLDDNVIYF